MLPLPISPRVVMSVRTYDAVPAFPAGRVELGAPPAD